jgi:hypothetical protein
MPISSITTNDTFGLHVTRTSQLITAYNALESNGALTVSVTAQTAFGVANSAFANGNTNFVTLQSAFVQANTARSHANTSFDVANAAFANANTTHTLTVESFIHANNAYDAANTAILAASPGFNQANTARNHANSAFAKANAALPNTTATFSGTLTVTGNVVSGFTASNTNTSVIRIATGSEFRSGASRSLALGVADVWDSAAEVSLTDSTTINVDMSTGFNFNVNLTSKATRTLATPTNMKIGQGGYIRIKQGSGASAQTISSFGAGWNFASGVLPVLSTGMGNTDLLFYQVLSSANVFGSLSKDVRLNY